MKVSVFVPIKVTHSTGCRLGWLVVDISHHPTACAGKGQGELPGTVCWLRNGAGHLASTTHFLLSSLEKKKEAWKGATRMARSNMHNICVFNIPQDNGSSRLHPPTAGSPFWLPFLWWDNIRDKNKIWPELGCLHLLLFTHVTANSGWEVGTTYWWGKEWGFSRELVWDGMGLGCIGVTGDCISGSEKEWDLVLLENGEIWEEKGNIRELFSSSTWGRKKSLLAVQLRSPGLALSSAGNTGRVFHASYTVIWTANIN